MKALLYGQAEYYYAISCEMTRKLEKKGIITADQRRRIDELDRKSIYEMYPSVDDLETETGSSDDADDNDNDDNNKDTAS